MITVTGATTGAPFWAAKGAKNAGGIVIGVSPAATKAEHVKVYHFRWIITISSFTPVLVIPVAILLLTRSADAVITVCGRIGTLNEFTDAFEDQKPQGVLLGTGGTTEMIREMLEQAHRGMGKVVFDTDPESARSKVKAMIEAR